MDVHIENAEGETFPRRQWCVVYDADTIRILHIQEYVTIAEAQADDKQQLDKQQLEAIALENATRYFPQKKLAILHPSTTDLGPSSVASIDPHSMTLQSTEGLIFDRLPTSSDQQ